MRLQRGNSLTRHLAHRPVDRGVDDGFIKIGNRGIVIAHADPGALLDALASVPAPPEAPWISGPEET